MHSEPGQWLGRSLPVLGETVCVLTGRPPAAIHPGGCLIIAVLWEGERVPQVWSLVSNNVRTERGLLCVFLLNEQPPPPTARMKSVLLKRPRNEDAFTNPTKISDQV